MDVVSATTSVSTHAKLMSSWVPSPNRSELPVDTLLELKSSSTDSESDHTRTLTPMPSHHLSLPKLFRLWDLSWVSLHPSLQSRKTTMLCPSCPDLYHTVLPLLVNYPLGSTFQLHCSMVLRAERDYEDWHSTLDTFRPVFESWAS